MNTDPLSTVYWRPRAYLTNTRRAEVLQQSDAVVVLEALARYFRVIHKKAWLECTFLRSYHHYYQPRRRNRERILFAREVARVTYQVYLRTGELPPWLVRVYELEIKFAQPSQEASIPPPDRDKKFFW